MEPSSWSQQLEPACSAPSHLDDGGATQVGTGYSAAALQRAERQVLRSLQGAKGRALDGEALESLLAAVEVLERSGGVPDPTNDPSLNGMWKLLFTSRPGSASPIQRAFVGNQAFTVLQEVDLEAAEPRVNNIVRFGSLGQLKVRGQRASPVPPLMKRGRAKGDGGRAACRQAVGGGRRLHRCAGGGAGQHRQPAARGIHASPGARCVRLCVGPRPQG